MGSASCYGKPFFKSLWVRAWGEQYPLEVEPFSSCTRDLLQQLLRETRVPPGGRFVDLGCGSGGTVLWLAQHTRAHGLGVDRKQAAIDIARDGSADWAVHGQVEFRCADFTDTGLAEQSVDAVVSVDAFPSGSEICGILRECRRVLRPAGRLVFAARQPVEGTDRWARLGPEWKTVLRRTGFDLVSAVERPGVSALWQAVYSEWTAHASSLRAELPRDTVDGLLNEVRRNGPAMLEARAWLLVTAVPRESRAAVAADEP